MNPEQITLKDLNVYGFCSHKPERYPKDRQWFSCFSNWYRSVFDVKVENINTNSGIITFNCVEQYLMWSKACLFKDEETAKKIMATDDPAEMKELGRHVKGYIDKDWVAARYNIVLRGIRAKFTQIPEIQAHLMKTDEKLLAEAAHYDCVWGIGLRPTDPNIQDQTKWKGQNLLGKALMEVRHELGG